MLHDENRIVGKFRLNKQKVGIIPFAFFGGKLDKSAMPINVLRQRVIARLARLRTGAVEAAASVTGLERNYIRDLVEEKKSSFNQNKLELVARALQWTVPELLGQATSAPLLDQVSAGDLLSPLSQIDASMVPQIHFSGLGDGEFFALTVDGDSMNKQSPSGSIIIVDKSDTQLVTGKSYVFAVNGGHTYKLWKANPKSLVPNSTNKNHSPRMVHKSEFEIIGRVKRTIFDL